METIFPGDGWQPSPWCARCGAPVPHGYRYCEDCHWEYKAAIDGALGGVPWPHASADVATPLLRCDICAEGTDSPYITGDRDEEVVCYCPNCLLRTREVMLAVNDPTSATYARYTDWPGYRYYVALQTTEHALDVSEDERAPWTTRFSAIIVAHNRAAVADPSGTTRQLTVDYAGRESDGDWLAVHAPDLLRLRLRLLAGNDDQSAA